MSNTAVESDPASDFDDWKQKVQSIDFLFTVKTMTSQSHEGTANSVRLMKNEQQ